MAFPLKLNSFDDMSPVTRKVGNGNSKRIRLQADDQNGLPIELTNITGTYLHHINDDCLLEIFSVKSLTPLDLCSIVETCTRFQRIAKRVFPKKEIEIQANSLYDIKLKNDSTGGCSTGCRPPRQTEVFKKFQIENDYKEDFDFKFRNSWHRSSARDIERIFKNFGSILSAISTLSLGDDDPTTSRLDYVLRLVARYCVVNLESLKIEHKNIPRCLTNKYAIRHFQKFAFRQSSDDLEQKQIDNAVLLKVFPKLERFTYNSHECLINPLLSTFISRHSNLKTIEICTKLYDRNAMDILRSIGDNCKDLKELRLEMNMKASSLLPLQALKSLKTLKLQSASCEDWSIITTMARLEELQLDYCILPTDSNQFAFLTQLTKLRIYASGSYDVVGMIKQLINLDELIIEGASSFITSQGVIDRFVLDEQTFSKIATVVKGRPNVLTLECKFNFFYNSKNCDENQKVRLVQLR